MSEKFESWLSIIGIHPDGLDGLSAAARRTLDDACVVFGSARQLALAEVTGERAREWPVPFDLAPLLALRGQQGVVMLASGDPFHFGAGASVAHHLHPGEWRNFPAPSTFALICGVLGWSQETTQCLGLHARPLTTLTPMLAEGERFICLLRDGVAAQELTAWLGDAGWGATTIHFISQAGGRNQSMRSGRVQSLALELHANPLQAPIAAAFEARGGAGFSRVPGRGTAAFAHDAQITKAPVRAITLATLAPRKGEVLWDLGAGSGSVAVEWCLAGGSAICVEKSASRVANIERNAHTYALPLKVLLGESSALLPALQPEPDAVFVGGGFERALFDALRARITTRWRLVVNAVTLETQALLMALHREHGGQLQQLQWSEAGTLGRVQAWDVARPVMQWSWRCAV